MIADESLITVLTATIYHAMNEQRTQYRLNYDFFDYLIDYDFSRL
jgi:hypothetical protein